ALRRVGAKVISVQVSPEPAMTIGVAVVGARTIACKARLARLKRIAGSRIAHAPRARRILELLAVRESVSVGVEHRESLGPLLAVAAECHTERIETGRRLVGQAAPIDAALSSVGVIVTGDAGAIGARGGRISHGRVRHQIWVNGKSVTQLR